VTEFAEDLRSRDWVIASMKRHYWAGLLRTLADEDDNIIELWG
jgi:hypothetical protein